MVSFVSLMENSFALHYFDHEVMNVNVSVCVNICHLVISWLLRSHAHSKIAVTAQNSASCRARLQEASVPKGGVSVHLLLTKTKS